MRGWKATVRRPAELLLVDPGGGEPTPVVEDDGLGELSRYGTSSDSRVGGDCEAGESRALTWMRAGEILGVGNCRGGSG
jgi:hypothetical protein